MAAIAFPFQQLTRVLLWPSLLERSGWDRSNVGYPERVERMYQRDSIRIPPVESNLDRTHWCRISCHFHLMNEFISGEIIIFFFWCPPARDPESFGRFWNDDRSPIHWPYVPRRNFDRKGIADLRPLLQSSLWKTSINRKAGEPESFREATPQVHCQSLVNLQVRWKLNSRSLGYCSDTRMNHKPLIAKEKLIMRIK